MGELLTETTDRLSKTVQVPDSIKQTVCVPKLYVQFNLILPSSHYWLLILEKEWKSIKRSIVLRFKGSVVKHVLESTNHI